MKTLKFQCTYKPTGEKFVPSKINFNDNTVYGTFDNNEYNWCHFSFDGSYGDALLKCDTFEKLNEAIEQQVEKVERYEKALNKIASGEINGMVINRLIMKNIAKNTLREE